MQPLSRTRQGTPQDATTISALAIQVYLDTYATQGIRPDLAREVFRDYAPEAFLTRLESPDCRFFLEEIGDGLIGFAEVDLRPTIAPGMSDAGAELIRLYVQPAFQRRGVGTRLIAAAEEAASAAGLPALWLTAWDGNERARAFYTRRGYGEVGETFHLIEGERYRNLVFCLTL